MRTAVVVGSGVAGLTVAWELQDRGWKVHIYADRILERTTSFLAAAVWYPTSVGPRTNVFRWGSATFDTFEQLARQGVPGVVMRESLALYREEPGRPWWTEAIRSVRPARLDELPCGYSHGLRYTVPLTEMPVYLPWLTTRVLERGGIVTRQRLNGLSDVGSLGDAIINCAGLGARSLAADSAVFPIRGQVVRVTNPGLRMSIRDESHPGGRTYVHPRRDDVICGGTAEEGVWDERPSADTSCQILQRCIGLAPQLSEAKVIEELAGLRPARPSVRVEKGRELLDGAPVFHNYGHGGAGITLSWGCARQVSDLVEDTFR